METLAVVEVLGRRGEVVAREKIHSLPATIGRGFDSDVILDDEFVAPHHLQLEAADDGGFRVSDLGTVKRLLSAGWAIEKIGCCSKCFAWPDDPAWAFSDPCLAAGFTDGSGASGAADGSPFVD